MRRLDAKNQEHETPGRQKLRARDAWTPTYETHGRQIHKNANRKFEKNIFMQYFSI